MTARRVALEAFLHRRQENVLALVRGLLAVGIGALVATATAYPAVGGVGESGAPPPDDRDVRWRDPDRVGRIPANEHRDRFARGVLVLMALGALLGAEEDLLGGGDLALDGRRASTSGGDSGWPGRGRGGIRWSSRAGFCLRYSTV